MDRRVQVTPAVGCVVRPHAPARHQSTPASVGMTAAELIGELYETISTLNRDRGWNLTMVAPARFGEIVIDREAGCLRAKCAWKAKDPSQLGPEPAGYVRGE